MYPYQYTWFNLFGNFVDISKNFEVDYWGVSGKNIAKKINNNDKILFNKNFISINKSKFTWDQLKATILHEISDFIGSGIPILDTCLLYTSDAADE